MHLDLDIVPDGDPDPHRASGRVPQHIGDRLLHHPVRRLSYVVGGPLQIALVLEGHLQTRPASGPHQIANVHQLGALLLLAEEAHHPPDVAEHSPSGLLDRQQRPGGVLDGARRHRHPAGTGLDRDRPHSVAHGVVQIPSNPKPLRGHHVTAPRRDADFANAQRDSGQQLGHQHQGIRRREIHVSGQRDGQHHSEHAAAHGSSRTQR